MKQTSKIVYLLLAFVLPVSIFVFLRTFGRNEFDVAPLFANEAPPNVEGCDVKPALPYVVPDSIRSLYNLSADSLTVIFFGQLSGEELNQLDRMRENTVRDPVKVILASDRPLVKVTGSEGVVTDVSETRSEAEPGQSHTDSVAQPATSADNSVAIESIRRCIFFLNDKADVVMLDSRGVIRGHYQASNRDEMDRLLTEVTILLKKY